MEVTSRGALRVAAAFGFLAVALGAFGAHGLQKMLTPQAMSWWEKAVFYHFIHAAVLLLLAFVRPFPAWAFGFFAAGIVAFSGSLYLLALTGAHWLVFVTPFGGLCLLAGWLTLLVLPARVDAGAR